MTRCPSALRRGLVAATVVLFAVAGLATDAGAAEAEVTDAAGDVPYARGDITRARVIHRSANIDLRVRTRQGGQPVNTWPNRQSYIRWLINADGDAAFEYTATLRLATGEDTLLVGRVVPIGGGLPLKGCEGAQGNNGSVIVSAVGNEYRFQFLRGCIGAPTEFRARATFRWDNGNPNVGPVYTDLAPNGGTIGPVVSS